MLEHFWSYKVTGEKKEEAMNMDDGPVNELKSGRRMRVFRLWK
jgi:hypothetical protein